MSNLLNRFWSVFPGRTRAGSPPRRAPRLCQPVHQLRVEELECRIVPSVAELVKDINLNTLGRVDEFTAGG
jgi:hypothetical protein